MEVERFVLPLYSLAELRMVICGWNFVIQILWSDKHVFLSGMEHNGVFISL